MHKIRITIICAFFISVLSSQAQTITNLQSGKKTSIRGLSVVDDKVAWISGSGGNVAITKDGGNSWIWQQVKDFEKSDFRDIEAFSDKDAVVMSSGTPAYILKTADGGLTWTKHFEQRDTSYFLDAMDFKDPKHGFVLGDPINGKFLLLKTDDGGNSWISASNSPNANKNEAAFAASGTCIRVVRNDIMIVSGGSKSRLITSNNDGTNWHYFDLPLTDGTPSRGAFSVAKNGDKIIVVGGNYARDKLKDSVAVILNSAKKIKIASTPLVSPNGFQSSVEHLEGELYLSTGTSGTNISINGGNTWKKIDDRSYNVCRKSKSGKLVLLAGDRGNIGVLKF